MYTAISQQYMYTFWDIHRRKKIANIAGAKRSASGRGAAQTHVKSVRSGNYGGPGGKAPVNFRNLGKKTT